MMGIISFLKNLFKIKRKNKKIRIKCRNCGHNIVKRSGRWWHYSSKKENFIDDEQCGGINEIRRHYFYNIKCRYKGCKCKKPLPKIRRKKRGI